MRIIPRIACVAVALGGMVSTVASAQTTKNSLIDDVIVIEDVTLISPGSRPDATRPGMV